MHAAISMSRSWREKTLAPTTLLVMLICAAPAAAQDLALEPVAEDLTAPLHLEEPADGSGRKFIVQQNGVVQVLGPDGRLAAEPLLDLRSRMLPLEQNFEERGGREPSRARGDVTDFAGFAVEEIDHIVGTGSTADLPREAGDHGVGVLRAHASLGHALLEAVARVGVGH